MKLTWTKCLFSILIFLKKKTYWGSRWARKSLRSGGSSISFLSRLSRFTFHTWLAIRALVGTRHTKLLIIKESKFTTVRTINELFNTLCSNILTSISTQATEPKGGLTKLFLYFIFSLLGLGSLWVYQLWYESHYRTTESMPPFMAKYSQNEKGSKTNHLENPHNVASFSQYCFFSNSY